MTKLQEWKEAKRQEFSNILRDRFSVKSSGLTNDTLNDLDTSFDELIALVEREVLDTIAKSRNLDEGLGFAVRENTTRAQALADVAVHFARLRGETNE